MKAGHVATIRINPRDCQSVLDVLDAAGVPRKALSFAQCVSLAMGCLLETARKGGVIPEPDEFEYLNRMQAYLGPNKRVRTARMAEAISGLGGSMRAPALAGPEVGEPQAAPSPRAAVEVSPEELEEAQRELTALLTKKEIHEDNDGPWTMLDQLRFDAAYKIVYPDG